MSTFSNRVTFVLIDVLLSIAMILNGITLNYLLNVYIYEAIQPINIFSSDIDECSLGNAGCNQTCHDVDGSYFCSCYSGYQLATDQHTCTGILGF